MELFRALLLPLAVLCLGGALLIGGRASQILAIAGRALASVAAILILAG